MKTDQRLSAFQELPREEKINRLKTDLQIFENSKNVLYDIYMLVSTESEVLTDELLDDIYKILLELVEGMKDKNLGEKVNSLKHLEEKIQSMRQEEEQDKDQDIAESEKLLAQL